jgi:hypothetical protein
MKFYLLILGYDEAPCRGTGDWIGCFETEKEALERLKEYEKWDWYKVVDLREWMMAKED